MASPQKFNMRNPSVKRIMQEIKEMQADTSDEYVAEALEEDIFEWHFAIRGPKGTEFEGGIYHGRITLPPEYPFKPPSFIMLTPSGRQRRAGLLGMCCGISMRPSHHQWQDMSPEDRRELAVESVIKVPVVANNPTRTQVIASLHERLLHKTPAAEQPSSTSEEPSLAPPQPTPPPPPLQTDVQRAPQSPEERALTLLAGALVAIIIAILLRKCVAGLDVLTTGYGSPI